MGKKLIKCKMRKFIPNICTCLILSLILLSCGMPGPLYQTPEKQVDDTTKTAQSSKKQQEN